MTNLDQIAQEAELKQNSPERFYQFVEKIDDDGETNVFIDGPALAEYLAEQNIEGDAALILLSEKISEAAALETDVAIPVAAFTTVIAGTPHFAALRDHMKLSTTTENPAKQKEAREQNQQFISRLMAEAQQNVDDTTEAQAIFETVRDQLIDTGQISPANASAMAQVVPAWATVYAKKNGISVQEAFDRSNLTITGPQTGKKEELDGEQSFFQALKAGSDQSAYDAAVAKGLDVSTKARLYRAKKQGFTQDVFHGTNTPDSNFEDQITEFDFTDLGFHVGITADPANVRLSDKEGERTGAGKFSTRNKDFGEGGNVLPLKMKMENPLRMGDVGEWRDPVSVAEGLLKSDLIRKMTPEKNQEVEETLNEIISEANQRKSEYEGTDEYLLDPDVDDMITDLRGIILDAGYDAVIYRNFVESSGGSSDSVVVLDPSNIKSVNAVFDPDSIGSPDLLAQTQGGPTARGHYEPGNSVIRLTEASDLSTFLHEFAHFMFEMERKAGGSTLDSINSWFGRNTQSIAAEAGVTESDVAVFLDGGTGNTAKDQAIIVAFHEQFAEGFERYLMEGVSPSVELRNVFRQFARWLTEIYRSVRNQLSKNLDNEMREVFDAMLATEEQMEQARARSRIEPLFTDAAMAGMTELQYQSYLERQAKAKAKEDDTLRDKLIKQITRQNTQAWKEQRDDFKVEEENRLRNEKVYVAMNTLKTTDLKLELVAMKDTYGKQETDKRGVKSVRIPRKFNGMTATGGLGVHQDEAAALLGYRSGDEMVQEILSAPSISEAATEAAEARMLAEHGDILNDGTIEQQADEALQNEERGKLLLAELKQLNKGLNVATLDRMTIKQMAEDNIAKLGFRQIHPGKYRKAEIAAAQNAATALAAGNKVGAAAAKQRQVLNYYLGMAATNARNDTTSIVDWMSRYNKKSVREAILKAQGGHWEQIVKILERFEFRKSATLKSIEAKNLSLEAWMASRNSTEGDALTPTNLVLNELYQTHWKNVPYGELVGVRDSVKNIEHVARYANRMTAQQEEIDFQKLIDNLVNQIESSNPEKFPKAQRTDAVTARKAIPWVASQMTKMPWLFTELDGGDRVGLVHETLMQPFNDANNNELNMLSDSLQNIFDLIENRSKEDIKRHNSTVHIPEIKDANNDGNLRGHQIVAVALNTGNQGNLRKMLLGEGWANPDDTSTITRDNPQLQAVLAKMTKSDWELVTNIWDQMESLYPQLAEVHRKTTGLTPPQVEATPFSVQVDGQTVEMKGGYYPMVYDPKRSEVARNIEKKEAADVEGMFAGGGSIQNSVNTGATNERTGFYAPVKLSLEVVPNHFQDVIHFITHHDAVRQTNKIIRNDRFREAVISRVGETEYQQLEPWLTDIAKAGKNAPVKSFIDEAFSTLRTGTTLNIMGFKASTGIIQTLGISNSMAELGAGKTFEGLKMSVSRSNLMRSVRGLMGSTDDLQTGMDFALERSKVLSHRIKTMDREMAHVFNQIGSQVDVKSEVFGVAALKAFKRSKVLRKTQEVAMLHIALIQLYSVDLPSWHAAYSSGLEQWGDEDRAARYGDFVVENVQGSGAIKDMSAIMRNQSKTHLTFTMFMTFFSTLWNTSRDVARGASKGRITPVSIAAKLGFLYFIPNFLEMFFRGDLSGDEEPDEKLQEYLLKTALYPVQSVPFYRDIANGVSSDYGYTINPVAGLLGKGVVGSSSLLTAAFDEDKDATFVQYKNTTKLLAAILGVPGTNQIFNTGEHLYNVLEDGEELTLSELTFGPDRDK